MRHHYRLYRNSLVPTKQTTEMKTNGSKWRHINEKRDQNNDTKKLIQPGTGELAQQ